MFLLSFTLMHYLSPVTYYLSPVTPVFYLFPIKVYDDLEILFE